MPAAYKLLLGGGVLRAADGASIPPDPANTDYMAYLLWAAAGGTPDPADPAPEPEPDPMLEGLALINDMAGVIDYGSDSAMAELIAVFQAQCDLLRLLRGG